ncbi:MAG: hypothetical protein JXM69_18760 [Anaerolineae bacterium]|nr:hypothetical protein [Anaerolineae bacterium]
MATLREIARNVAGGLLKQRKPEVLQNYAAQVARALHRQASGLLNLNAVHQYQGDGTNHCGPTTLAMIINLLLGERGYDFKLVNFNDLQAAMQAGSLSFGLTGYRLNADLFQEVHIGDRITGATLPWGLLQAFKDFNEGLKKSGGPDLGSVSFAEKGTKQKLINNIKKGYKTAIMLVWPNNAGAHWIAVVDYDPDTDEFSVLDPAHPKDEISKMAWSYLGEHWNRPIGITNLPDLPFLDEERLEDMLTLEGVMITFKPK